MKKRHDIFISYRRTSFDIANLISVKLNSQGYSAFIDIEALRSGKFNEKLFEVIEGCKDFILVLPPNALDRCADEEDWVRKEVEHAIKHNKNIIPIMLRGFTWPAKETLPETLRELPLYNGLTVSDANLFIDNMERLKRSLLKSRPYRKLKQLALGLFIVIATILSVITFVYKPNQQQHEQEVAHICADCAILLNNNYYIVDLNLQGVCYLYDEWNYFFEDYYSDYREDAIEDFKAIISAQRQMMIPLNDFEIKDSDYIVLSELNISRSDIEALDEGLRALNDELAEQFRIFEQIMEYPKLYVDYIEDSKQYFMSSLKYYYYSLLEIHSLMPESIDDEIKEILTILEYFTEISTSDDAKEYERKQVTTKHEIERLARKMNGIIQ